MKFFYPQIHSGEMNSRLVSPNELGTLLKKFKIFNAITNACNSGKAGIDPSLSFTGGLIKEGVHNAAAMAFAVSNTAATIFIETFYLSYFFQGESFQNSVSLARNELASTTRRPARFTPSVELFDYFLPVSFSSIHAREYDPPQMVQRTDPGMWHNLATALWEMVPRERGNELGEPNLVGREDELAALEGHFIPLYENENNRTNIILIYGMLGTGKSTFAEHVCWWWHNTGMADDFVYVRINPRVFGSPMSTIMTTLQRKLSVNSAREVINKLRDERVVILLDDLNHLTQWSTLVEDPSHQQLKDFLSEVYGGKSIIILTSTSRETWLMEPYRPFEFELKGLSDMDCCFAIMNSVMDQSGIQDMNSKDYRFLEKIASLVSGNPSALRAICWKVNASHPNALNDHYTTLRRGIPSEMVKRWSSHMGGFTISLSGLKVKRFLEGCFGSPPDDGFLFLSLANHAGRVHSSWIRFIASVSANLWPESETNLSMENWVDIFHTMTNQLEEIGLLAIREEDPEYLTINPLFTYMIRMNIQNGKLGSPELAAMLRTLSNNFHLSRDTSDSMNTGEALAEWRDMGRLLEQGYVDRLNIFDDLLDKEVDEDANIMSTLDDFMTSNEIAEQLLEQLSLGDLNEERPREQPESSPEPNLSTFNHERVLFHILQEFMMQNLTSTTQPLIDETIEMCEKYLNRLHLDISTEKKNINLSLNLCAPAVTAAAWLAQYYFGPDLHKAQQYINLSMLVCDAAITGRPVRQNIMYYIFRLQLLLQKAGVAMLRGDMSEAEASNREVVGFTLSDEDKEGIEDFIDPFLASSKVIAYHGLYNIALLSKTIQEAEPERKVVQNALRHLASNIGRPEDGDENASSNETRNSDISNLFRGIMNIWNMDGISESMGDEASVTRCFQSPVETYFTYHGLLCAEANVSELPPSPNPKEILQDYLEGAIHKRDYVAAHVYHSQLIEAYIGSDDWRAAYNQLVQLKEMLSQHPPALFQFDWLPPSEGMMRDMRDGVLYLFGADLASSHGIFLSIIRSPTRCHSEFLRRCIETGPKLRHAISILRAVRVSDDEINQLSIVFNNENDGFKEWLLQLGTQEKELSPYAETDESLLEVILLGLYAYHYLGGISGSALRQAIRLLIEGCRKLSLELD